MAGWTLVSDLTSLKEEFNTLAPARSKISDGSIGDAAHQKEASDHNPDDTPGVVAAGSDTDNVPEVHAIDVTEELNLTGWTMAKCCDIIRLRHMHGDDNRLQNIIHNRRIASKSWGWTWQAYSGADPHTGHAHFSSRYGSGNGTGNPENVTTAWGLLAEQTAERNDTDMATASDVWNAEFGPVGDRETAGERLAHVDAAVDVLATKTDVAAAMTQLATKIDSLTALLIKQQ